MPEQNLNSDQLTTLPSAWDFVYERLGRHIAPHASEDKSLGQAAGKYFQWSNKEKDFTSQNFSQAGGFIVVDSGSTAAVLGNYKPAQVGPVSFHCAREGHMSPTRSPLAHALYWILENKLVFPLVMVELGKRHPTPADIVWSYSPKRVVRCSASNGPLEFNLDVVKQAHSLVSSTTLAMDDIQKAISHLESFHFPRRADDVQKAGTALKSLLKKHEGMNSVLLENLYRLIKPRSGEEIALSVVMSN